MPPPVERLGVLLAAALVRTALALLGATWRVETLGGEVAEGLVDSGRPAVLAHWHDRLVGQVHDLARRFLRRGYPVTIMASRSRDGELGARVARAWGTRVVRGSASRGGTEGLRSLHRALARERSAVVVIPDGPRGPLHRAKPGALVLAQMARAPVVPMSCAADRAWRLGSWDRMEVPKPFAHLVVAFGEPFEVPRDLRPAELEAARRRLEAALEELGGRAAARLAERRGRGGGTLEREGRTTTPSAEEEP